VARLILQNLKNSEGEIFEEKGKFLSLDSNKDNFSSSNQNPFYRSCGFYRDWPDARFIYINGGQALTLIVNEEDHLKIILNFNSKDNLPVQRLNEYSNLLQKLSKNLNFAFDKNLGYLNSLLSNLGSGTNFRVKIKIPENKKKEIINHFKNKSDLQIKESKEDNNIIEISNITPFFTISDLITELMVTKDLLS
jgi:protein-arginine kinase